jgi:hypothetical protein
MMMYVTPWGRGLYEKFVIRKFMKKVYAFTESHNPLAVSQKPCIELYLTLIVLNPSSYKPFI